MTLPQVLNATAAWLASQIGWAAVKTMLGEDKEPERSEPAPVDRARLEAIENREGVHGLSQLAALPRAGSR